VVGSGSGGGTAEGMGDVTGGVAPPRSRTPQLDEPADAPTYRPYEHHSTLTCAGPTVAIIDRKRDLR